MWEGRSDMPMSFLLPIQISLCKISYFPIQYTPKKFPMRPHSTVRAVLVSLSLLYANIHGVRVPPGAGLWAAPIAVRRTKSQSYHTTVNTKSLLKLVLSLLYIVEPLITDPPNSRPPPNNGPPWMYYPLFP